MFSGMFSGMITATVTPFHQNKEIDYAAYREHIAWLLSENVDGIVCFGTTGEAPTLTLAEKVTLLKETLAIAKGKVPVIAGTGSYNTQESVELTKTVMALGADGCLVVTPYYNRPSPAGCWAHFNEVAKVGLPMIVYHHPERTTIKHTAQFLAQIAEIPNVAGIKEGPGDPALVAEFCRLSSKPIFSGTDGLTLPCMAVGAKGVISAVGNVIPREWKQMVSAFAAGDPKEAYAIFSRNYDICQALFLENNPQCVKYALSLMNKCLPDLRLPLVEPTEASKQKLQEVIKSVFVAI